MKANHLHSLGPRQPRSKLLRVGVGWKRLAEPFYRPASQSAKLARRAAFQVVPNRRSNRSVQMHNSLRHLS